MFGFGIELETGIYYNHDGYTYALDVEKLLKKRKKAPLFEEEKYLLDSLPLLESPSNKCLVKIFAKQIELVTKFPIDKKIEEAIYELETNLKRFLIIFQKLFNFMYNRKDIKLFYPKLSCMKYYDINGEETFSNTGSIHINITFPYYGKSQLNKYKRFIEIFQTLEPIFTALTSSGDYRYNEDGYPKSGYRQIIGWGISGGSDKNLLKYGLSKSSTFTPEYIKKLDKYELTPIDNEKCSTLRMKVDYHYYKSKKVNIEESNFSSDIATINKKYFLEVISYFDKNIAEKFSFRTYKEGFGIEIRFFDWMEPKNIQEIVNLLILMGEFSFETKHNLKNSQRNKFWNNQLLDVFENGYKSKLSGKYLELLEHNLDMKIKKGSCESVLNQIINMLYKEYGEGDFVNTMTENKGIKKPKIFNMNKEFLTHFK